MKRFTIRSGTSSCAFALRLLDFVALKGRVGNEGFRRAYLLQRCELALIYLFLFTQNRASMSSWRDSHVVSVHDAPIASRSNLDELFEAADILKKKVECGDVIDMLAGRVAALVFFEPSTRTRCSFEAAMYRLGGKVLQIDAKTSSNKKGETLEDTLRCLECYCDVMVMRHPSGSSKRGAAVLQRPLLNAGDGARAPYAVSSRRVHNASRTRIEVARWHHHHASRRFEVRAHRSFIGPRPQAVRGEKGKLCGSPRSRNAPEYHR